MSICYVVCCGWGCLTGCCGAPRRYCYRYFIKCINYTPFTYIRVKNTTNICKCNSCGWGYCETAGAWSVYTVFYIIIGHRKSVIKNSYRAYKSFITSSRIYHISSSNFCKRGGWIFRTFWTSWRCCVYVILLFNCSSWRIVCQCNIICFARSASIRHTISCQINLRSNKCERNNKPLSIRNVIETY